MKLSEVMAVWELIHGKYIGEFGLSDLVNAIESAVGVENDVTSWQPQARESKPKEQPMLRKVIVQITESELRELCGIPEYVRSPGLYFNDVSTVVQVIKESPGDVLVKFYGDLLPIECETSEAEVITRLSLRKMQAMMAAHNRAKGVEDE